MFQKFFLGTFSVLGFSLGAYSNSIKVDLRKVMGDQVTYDQIKPIMEANCVSCHGEAAPKAGLVLSKFPFTSTKPGLDLNGIVDKVLLRAADENRPMPPKTRPPLTADQIALIQSWKDGGLLTEAKTIYETAIQLIGTDGEVIKEEVNTSDTNPFDSGIAYTFELPSETPDGPANPAAE